MKTTDSSVVSDSSFVHGRSLKRLLIKLLVASLIAIAGVTAVFVVGLYALGWERGPVVVLARVLPLPAATVGTHHISARTYFDYREQVANEKQPSTDLMSELIEESYVQDYVHAHHLDVSDDQAQAYLQARKITPNPARMAQARLFLARSGMRIAIAKDDQQAGLARQKAIAVLESLKKGADFADAARKATYRVDSSPLITYQATALTKDAADVVFKLKTSQVADEPLVSGNRFILLKRTDNSASGQAQVNFIVIKPSYELWLENQQQKQPPHIYLQHAKALSLPVGISRQGKL